MRAQDIMTTNPVCCTPDQTLADVALLMDRNDCGCLPVVSDEGGHLIGVVTDRDLAVRGLAGGADGNTPVVDVMSSDVSCCRPGDDIGLVERIMADRMVRRVPVIDEENCCIGMIAQADLARHAGTDLPQDELVDVLGSISRPINDDRADAEVGIRVGRQGPH